MFSLAAMIYHDDRSVDGYQIRAFTNALFGCSESSIQTANLGSCAVGIKYPNTIQNHKIARPVESQDRNAWILLIGRIDNFNELQNNTVTQTISEHHSDGVARCVLEGFLDQGECWLNQIYGPFIFIIYIKTQKRLILCRDPMGDRSLYYLPTLDNMTLVSSDEMAIVRACPTTITSLDKPLIFEVNKSRVAAYFINQPTVTNDALFSPIKQLPAGCYLDSTPDRRQLIQYWYFDQSRTKVSSVFSYQDALDGFRLKLNNAVKRVINGRSTVPILLSGGLDSGSITGLARQNNVQLLAISHVFDRFSECDERCYLNMLYEKFGLEQLQINVGDCLPLSGDPSQLHNSCNHIWIPPMLLQRRKSYPILKALNHHCFLTGEFGDHLFAGHRYWFRDLLYSSQAIGLKIAGFKHIIKNPDMPFYKNPVLRRVFPFNGITSKYKKKYPHWLTDIAKAYLKETSEIEIKYSNEQFGRDRYEQFFNHNSLELNSIIRDEAAYYGLGTLMPFKERELVEYSLNLPVHMFFDYQTNWHKYVLRESMKGLLPNIVRERMQSTVYNTIFKASLMCEQHDVMHEILIKGDQLWSEYVSKEHIEKLVSSQQVNDQDLLLLWNCICFELWTRKVAEMNNRRVII